MIAPKFLGIPYKKRGMEYDGADCWGVAALFLQEAGGIPMSDMAHVSGNVKSHDEVLSAADGVQGWHRVEPPWREFDILLFKMGRTLHVGVALDEGTMLTAYAGVGSAVVGLDQRIWRETLSGGFRHDSNA